MALQDNWDGFFGFETELTKLDDNSGSGNNITFVSSPAPTYYEFGGKPSGYYDFTDGTNQRLETNPNSVFSFSSGTNDKAGAICFFFTVSQLLSSGNKGILTKGGASTQREWEVTQQYISAGVNRLRFGLMSANTTGNMLIAEANLDLQLGVPYFAVINYDGSKTIGGITIKINDVNQSITNRSTGTYVASYNYGYQFLIGRGRTLGSGFSGSIDLVGFRNTLISASEATELYNGGLGKNPFYTPPSAVKPNYWFHYFNQLNT